MADPARARAGGTLQFGIVGLIAVGVAFGMAEIVAAVGQTAGLLHISSSPVTALGNSFIALTPEWLAQWAIRHFGVHDKTVLLAGMAATAVAIAVAIGVIARRHPQAALGVFLALAAVTEVAVWTRSGASPADGLPVGAGALAGGWFLIAAGRRIAVPDIPSRGDRRLDRRRFLRFAVVGAAAAALAGAVSRWIPSAAEVQASRARINIPVPTDSNAAHSGTSSQGATTGIRAGTGPIATSSASSDPTPAPRSSSMTSVPPTPTSNPPTNTATAPNAFDSVDGITPFVTSNKNFYRIDTTLTPPLITAENWTLRIHGMVARAFTVNYFELMARPQIERMITLTCVSNYVGGHLVGNARWIGPRIDALLREASPLPGADCVLSTSVDGFTCSSPLAALTDGRDAMLAVAMNGEPLPIEHGFPVRMVVPGLYGYVSATKWVVDLEITAFSRISAYWTSRGWSTDGPVKLSSRIDVPAPSSAFSPGQLVTIAGVAWAQHRGVSAVQVQIDNGPWLRAELAGSVSNDTWRQWRYPWKATAGAHVIRCRAFDGRGIVQIGTDHDPQPDGATGYASVSISVR